MDYDHYNIVRGFDTIAENYDKGNDAMTFGLHRRWRQKLCRAADHMTPRKGTVLDVATGTGDVLQGILRCRPDVEAIGVDPSKGMLEIGRKKLKGDPQLQKVACSMQVGDCRELPFAEDTFDTVTISWGIRNVIPFTAGLEEIYRVLKPGGTILVLESGIPESWIMRRFYQIYSQLLPLIGAGMTGYKPAYEYYKHSVEKFASGRDFVAAMEKQGYVDCSYRPLMGGIIYLYQGSKLK